MKSVLQDWVMELPLRAQGTLLTGIRGCDVAPKDPELISERHGCSTGEGAERAIVAFLRFCVMNPHDPREVDIPGAFFRSRPPSGWKPSQFGHYPQHWYAHIMHCFEVCGYLHPDQHLRAICNEIYRRFVHNLHLAPETTSEMVDRLTEDRIAAGTVVS